MSGETALPPSAVSHVALPGWALPGWALPDWALPDWALPAFEASPISGGLVVCTNSEAALIEESQIMLIW